MEDKKLISKYGKDRCQDVFKFYDRICRYYGFPYSENTLQDWLEDLSRFTKNDLDNCLEYLKNRESTMPLKFNEIYLLCMESLKDRKVYEENKQRENEIKEAEKNRVPMPDEFRQKMKEILEKSNPSPFLN